MSRVRMQIRYTTLGGSYTLLRLLIYCGSKKYIFSFVSHFLFPVPTVSPWLATGWTVRGSNPGGGEILRTCPDRPWGPPSLIYNGYRVFQGSKAAGAWHWPTSPSSAEVKERVELYLYKTSEPSWPVLERTITLPLLSPLTLACILLTLLLRILTLFTSTLNMEAECFITHLCLTKCV
jgi:hypothetical protein